VILADDLLRQTLHQDPLLGGDHDAAILRAAQTGAPTPVISIVRSTGATRLDLAIVDGQGRATVVNGTGPAPSPEAVAAVEQRTLESLGRGDVLVLAGSLPPGMPGVLERLVSGGRARGAIVLVDTSGSWLREALAAGPQVVKINADEASGRSGESTLTGARPAGFEDIDVLAVTAGSGDTRAWIGDSTWRLTPPSGIAIANTVGAGDAVTAGLALGLAAGRDPIDALRLGTAMAAARLRHLETMLEPGDVPALERAVTVERLG
jgi:1-phosphofructokinase